MTTSSNEERFKMALEAIAYMNIPVGDDYRVDGIMQKIALNSLIPRTREKE